MEDRASLGSTKRPDQGILFKVGQFDPFADKITRLLLI